MDGASAGLSGFASNLSAHKKAHAAQAIVSKPLVAHTAAIGRLANRLPLAKACKGDKLKRRVARRVAARHNHAPATSELSSAGNSGWKPSTCQIALHKTHKRFV
jgi:hypothetical protein